ncbi:MAG: tetratricopeptide repeat protein [Bryobacteraceae bacterium]
MKRIILTGILALATGFAALAAPQAAPAQAAPAQPKVPSPKSPAEGKAVMALQTAGQSNDPDAMIKAANELLTKFTDTDYKEWALSMEAKAYQMKGDAEHAQVYGQQALQINPKSYSMMLLLGEVIALHIGDHDLDRQDKLTSAAKYLNDTIETVKTAPKPNPQLTDDQWAEYRKYTTAEAHNGLGLLAMVRKDWDAAIVEFKTAVDGDPQDAYNTRLASVYMSAGRYDESIAICDKLLANPSLHPQIKNVVNGIKNAAVAAKNKK